jgi:hypothetical protein
MRYSLWSGDRLLGHTDLDIHTVTSRMRQGFIDPTPDGIPLLRDATGVIRAMAEQQRARRARGGDKTTDDHDLFDESVRRREALNLELRDEAGAVFECDFMRVYDLFDMHSGAVEDMQDTEEEAEAEFEIHLSSLSAQERVEALARRAESDAEVEEMFAEFQAEREEQELYGSGWPPPPPEDPRWDTMQYHLQVFLSSSLDDDIEFPGQTFTGSGE